MRVNNIGAILIEPSASLTYFTGIEWWRSERDWTAKPPGAAIYHAPNVKHATRVLDVPLLAIYCWQGDTGTAAQLS